MAATDTTQPSDTIECPPLNHSTGFKITIVPVDELGNEWTEREQTVTVRQVSVDDLLEGEIPLGGEVKVTGTHGTSIHSYIIAEPCYTVDRDVRPREKNALDAAAEHLTKYHKAQTQAFDRSSFPLSFRDRHDCVGHHVSRSSYDWEGPKICELCGAWCDCWSCEEWTRTHYSHYYR